MIGLRVAQIVSSLRVSTATSSAINLSRWLTAHDHEQLLVAGEGERQEEVEQAGLELLSYHKRGSGWFFRGHKRVSEQVAQWSPDIIHCHRLDTLPLGLRLAKEGYPLVVSLHHPPDASDADDLANPLIGAITVPNEYMRSILIGKHGCACDRVSVLPYGLEPHRFAGHGVSEQVTTVGCFVDQDAVEAIGVLRAAGELEPALQECRMLLVAPPEQVDQVRAIVAAEPDHQRWQVEVAGVYTSPILAQMDAVVYPVAQDSHSLTVIKAQLAGRVVIASAVGSMPELIVDQVSGLLVQPGDAAALAAAMMQLKSDAGLAKQLAVQGRENSLGRHDLKAVGAAWEMLYRGLLRGSRSTTSDAQSVYRRLSEVADDRSTV